MENVKGIRDVKVEVKTSGPVRRKTFRVLLTADYAGTYYLPAVSAEAMYDHSIYARKKGQAVEVVKASPTP
jgi:uncharacterized protein YfaS (alpha-2-macroglobulin family)